MESFGKNKKFPGKTILTLFLLVLIGGAIYYGYERSASWRDALHSIKESSEDATITSKVRTALVLSKHVAPFKIKVETSQREVTLAGQVPSEEIKSMAGAIAQDTSGVKQVHNDVEISPSAERDPETQVLGERVADLEMKTIILDAISNSPELKDKHIEAQVMKRVITLTGSVETTEQKYKAEQIAWQIPGVERVTNDLSVTTAQNAPESADAKLAHRVEFELYSTRAISLKTLEVHAEDGTVTLTGNVNTRAEKLLAEKTAQSVDGVRKVVNELSAPEEVQP